MGMAIIDLTAADTCTSGSYVIRICEGTVGFMRSACAGCGWPPGLCMCVSRREMTRLADAARSLTCGPEFGWYRDFEPAQPPSKLLTTCATAAHRVWRRMRGHDIGQARRQKRRRFVQQLHTAHCA